MYTATIVRDETHCALVNVTLTVSQAQALAALLQSPRTEALDDILDDIAWRYGKEHKIQARELINALPKDLLNASWVIHESRPYGISSEQLGLKW